MRYISDPNGLETAWSQQYLRLAGVFAALLEGRRGTMVEVGCGRGQVTIPLARRVRVFRIIGVDNFEGPYSWGRGVLESKLPREGLAQRVQVVVGDFAQWLSVQCDCGFEAVVSSEFLGEIDSNEMTRFFAECYRVLRPGGITIQSFLSPIPRNSRQRLVIEANVNPRWTVFPPKEWLSPPSALVREQLEKAGFGRVRRSTLRSNLAIKASAARTLLQTWNIKDEFWRDHERELTQGGMEIPDWVLVSGVKPTTKVS